MFRLEERALSHISRFAPLPMIRKPNVGEHSFYVALYVSHLAELLDLEVSERLALLEYALRHDMDERLSGDIAGPAKREIVDRPKYDAFARLTRKAYGANHMEHIDLLGKMGEVAGYVSKVTYKDIVKAADLIDEVFTIAVDMGLGNRMLAPVMADCTSRMTTALERLGLSDTGLKIEAEVGRLLAGGWPIWSNNSDLPDVLAEDEEIPF